MLGSLMNNFVGIFVGIFPAEENDCWFATVVGRLYGVGCVPFLLGDGPLILFDGL